MLFYGFLLKTLVTVFIIVGVSYGIGLALKMNRDDEEYNFDFLDEEA